MSSNEGTLPFQLTTEAENQRSAAGKKEFVAPPAAAISTEEPASIIEIANPKIVIRDLNFYYGK